MFLFWAVVVAGLIAIVVIAANKKSPTGGSPAVASNTGAATSTTTASAPTTTATAPTTTPTNGASPTPQTLQSQNGSGIQSLPRFTVVPGNKGWLIHYLFDCSGLGSTGNFELSVHDANGRTVAVAANDLAAHGGSTYYNDTTGTYQLQVNSACRWTVVVQTIPQ